MYSISFDEVKQYVESLTDHDVVGECAAAYDCVIAKAIKAKYPDCHVGSWAGRPEIMFRAAGSDEPDQWYPVHTEDQERLRQLAKAFDSLGHCGDPITKEQVLPLFEEIQ